MGIASILIVTAVCLVVGHLLLKEYMFNPAVGALGFLILFAILFIVLVLKNQIFAYVMIIYSASHFAFAENQGGLWNLLCFGLLPIYLLRSNKRERITRSDVTMEILVVILVMANVLGWILKNPMPKEDIGLGAAVFLSYILMFRIVSNLPLTGDRLRVFLLVITVMIMWEVLVGINQRYGLFNFNTPLIGAYSKDSGSIAVGHISYAALGTMKHSELYGEYCALIIALAIPFLCASTTQKVLRIRKSICYLLCVLCLSGVLLSFSRSAAILTTVVCFVYLIGLLSRPVTAIDSYSRQIKFILFAALFLSTAGAAVGLGSLTEKMEQLSGTKFTLESVASGKALNRGNLFPMAFERMAKESWIIGFGHGVFQSNRWAWFGGDFERLKYAAADYHNLYVSLPMLYGWAGSVAFLLLIIVTATRVVLAVFRYHRKESYLTVFLTGLAVFWFIFLADQYKISILRNSGYSMMFWIWLGLSNAAVKTLYRDS